MEQKTPNRQTSNRRSEATVRECFDGKFNNVNCSKNELNDDQKNDLREFAPFLKTLRQQAHLVGVTEHSLQMILDKDEELAKYCRREKSLKIAKMGQVLYQKGIDGDAGSQKFYLEKMGGYTDELEIIETEKKFLTLQDMYPNDVNNISDKQRSAVIEEYEKNKENEKEHQEQKEQERKTT
jgi:DNA-directed RNA polymerase